MPEALSVQQIADTLELSQMQGRVWYIQVRYVHMHMHMHMHTHMHMIVCGAAHTRRR
jgi:hypothetical protein